jgi:hypothetical protein
MKGDAPFSVQKKAVLGDGPGRACAEAGDAGLTAFHHSEAPPWVVWAGQVREGADQLEEAPPYGDVRDVVPAIFGKPAANRQGLQRQVRLCDFIAFLAEKGAKASTDALGCRTIADIGRGENCGEPISLPVEDRVNLRHRYGEEMMDRGF